MNARAAMPDPPSAAPMRITLLLFARAAELAGVRALVLTVPADATVEAVWSALASQAPRIAAALAPLSGRVALARNQRYAHPGERLADGDEVAVIPPVSGG